MYTLTHKKLVHCTAGKYLQSEGLKLPNWLNGLKEGRRADTLAIFLLYKVMQTHCFIHVKSGFWSSLQEDPLTHQEYIQRYYLHLLDLGAGTYAELEAHTQVIQYEIFDVGEPLSTEINVNEPAISILSASESSTLNLLISNGTTHSQSKLTAFVKPSATTSKEDDMLPTPEVLSI